MTLLEWGVEIDTTNEASGPAVGGEHRPSCMEWRTGRFLLIKVVGRVDYFIRASLLYLVCYNPSSSLDCAARVYAPACGG